MALIIVMVGYLGKGHSMLDERCRVNLKLPFFIHQKPQSPACGALYCGAES